MNSDKMKNIVGHLILPPTTEHLHRTSSSQSHPPLAKTPPTLPLRHSFPLQSPSLSCWPLSSPPSLTPFPISLLLLRHSLPLRHPLLPCHSPLSDHSLSLSSLSFSVTHSHRNCSSPTDTIRRPESTLPLISLSSAAGTTSSSSPSLTLG
ncbi:hypothetical protein RJT34_07488 [Clitoria ternatea]|uniref:Uncharacterized protein n=1 Tax=Clitoria ternatea TaxID=43366 RepID=A0AAN9K2P0_CLITE